MIARDRGVELRRCLLSVAPHIDEIVIVDAGGSTDNTQDVAREFGARVIEYTPVTNPEGFYPDTAERFAAYPVLPGPFSGRAALADFSAPRNIGFEATTGDYILWLDSDDILVNGEKLRWIVEKMIDNAIDAAFFEYEYQHDEKGNCVVRQIRERIIRRGTAKWYQPIHEHMKGPKKGLLFHEVKVIHESPTVSVSENTAGGLIIGVEHRDRVAYRNLKNILVHKEAVEITGGKMDFRMEFYLGVEFRMIDPERSIAHFETYIRSTPWDEERAQARTYIAQVREAQQRNEEAWNFFAGAAMDFPGNPTAWFGMARIAFVRGEWKKVIEHTERGLGIVKDDDTVARMPSLIMNPHEWKYRALLPYTRALVEVGRYKEALALCEQGLIVNADCPYLPIHKQMAEEKLGIVPIASLVEVAA